MSRKTMLISAPLGLGALVLLWAAMAARGEPESKPARPIPKPAAAKRPVPVEAPAIVDAPAPTPAVSPAPAAPAEGGGEYAVISERIRKMEEKLLALEAKRNTLSGGNQELERQLMEKQAELSARTMAEWRVRNLESLLGLSANQKQALIDLWAGWTKQDAGRPADRETWLQRETDVRSQLSVEQAAKLHDNAATQSQQMWTNLGRSIGSMVGASKEEQTRYQQTLGDYRAPNAMLLPEGYGADWPGMMRDASGRLRPLLSADQIAKLDRFVQK
jgi:hypothetical protein